MAAKYVSVNVIVTISMLTPIVFSTECPFSCQCYQQSGINSIFCLKTGLTDIPNYFNFDVKILNFSGHHLPNLTNAFRNQRYKSLEILDLSRNSIASVDERALHQLKNLLEIDLSNNDLVSIPARLFDTNRFLNTVHLRGNPIEELADYAFSPSVYLRRLDFQGCRISRIHKFTFVNTPLLEYLNLQDNNLKSLSLAALHFTSQLTTLLLEGNPWRCNNKLWHLLKWMRSKNMANCASLCVYGETDNAILWDTMDVGNALKFRDTKVPPNVKRVRWSRSWPRTRPRRDSVAEPEMKHDEEATERRLSRDHRPVDHSVAGNAMAPNLDYPSLDHRPYDDLYEQPELEEEDDEFKEGESKDYSAGGDDYEENSGSFRHENKFPHLQDTLNYYQHGDPKLSIGKDAAKPESMPQWHKHQQKPPDWSLHPVPDRNNFGDNRRHPEQGGNRKDADHRRPTDSQENSSNLETNGVKNADESLATIKEFYYFTSSVDFDDKVKFAEKRNEETAAAPSNGTNGENGDAIVESAYSDDSDGVNIKFMLLVIAVEFLLLAVLLFVLYKLWKSNRRARETEVNTPLNNNKNMKTHDIHSPGYKRYSLSDDDFADMRKPNLDEAKYDSESGYLSYHRFNSTEGEVSNDGMHYRRNQRDENDAQSAYTNAELDSANGNDNRSGENETADRRMRRNSSMRSMGRRAKINIARRSYSDDIKHEASDV